MAWITKGDDRYLAIYPSGKTGPREAIARDRTERFLDRQRAMNPALMDKTLDEVIAAKIDDYVFKTRSGERVDYFNLARNFDQYLKENGMKRGPDGRERTLYSFRHFYATQDLARGITSDQLSGQLGNSAQVIDRYYSKLSPRMNAELHSGRAFLKKAEGDEDEDVALMETVTVVAEQPALSPAAAKAFDLFDAGKIGEAALLAALGVSRPGYSATDAVTVRALASVEAGTLKEDGFLKILR